MSISITPKNSNTVATQTMSIDELFEERYKERQTRDSKIVEELRPLCEELPPDALDPVTMEPFTLENIPLVFKCGHVFNKETIKSLIANNPEKNSGISCAVCKEKIFKNHISECVPLEGLVGHNKKINRVFKKYAE